MSRFSDIAGTKLGTVEKPPLTPTGHFVMAITKPGEITELGTANFQGEKVEFQCQAIQALDDVDAEEMAAYGDPKQIFCRHSFMFNNAEDAAASFARAQYELDQFLTEHLKLKGMSTNEAIGAASGAQFVAKLGLRQDKNNPDNYFPNIESTAAID